MVYSDLLFFLGLMPVSVLVSFCDRSTEYKNLILILTSVIFMCWAKPVRACVIFATVLSEYFLARGIEKTKPRNRSSAAVLLMLDLLIDLGVFLYFGHNYIFAAGGRLHLAEALIPVGAGYYTAKGFSYCLDVFTERCKAERNIFCLMTYMVSFHSLAAGPVVRYGDIEPAIRRRSVTGKSINDGLDLFIIGLGKAVILAPAFSRIAEIGLDPTEPTPSGAVIGMLSFLAGCWYGFTGLADMAKALGLFSGFDYPDNYRELTVKEGVTGFAKSANTTLIKLFEDFLGLFNKGGKSAPAAVLTLIGALTMALWYHISKPFLAVGLCFGLVLAAERLFLGKLLEKLPRLITAVYVAAVTLVITGGLYFDKFSDYKRWLGNTVGRGTDYMLSVSLKNALISNFLLILIAFINVCTPTKKGFLLLWEKAKGHSAGSYSACRICRTAVSAFILFLCVVTAAARAIG